MDIKRSNLGWMSFGVTVILIIVQVRLWIDMSTYNEIEPDKLNACGCPTDFCTEESGQIVNEYCADHYLDNTWEMDRINDEETIRIKTGIFIQSLKFSNSTEVDLTGYIWQRYTGEQLNEIKNKKGDIGFILPEQVNSNSIEHEEIYRECNKKLKPHDEVGEHCEEWVIGWYFEAFLRQPFDYSLYPFDHQKVWVRIWPKSFSKNIVLVPDFDAYDFTGLQDKFGIEEDIELGTWQLKNTYFTYKNTNYSTNFSINDYVGQRDFPELHYNFIIQRSFKNAFIINLSPLLLVSILLFFALLTVTKNKTKSNKLGFTTSRFIGASSALFFMVLLSHIHIREQFPGNGIVYIEYFYILMYGLLMFAILNTYLFSIGARHRWDKFIHHRDNIIVKVAYWPVVVTSMIIITLIVR